MPIGTLWCGLFLLRVLFLILFLVLKAEEVAQAVATVEVHIQSLQRNADHIPVVNLFPNWEARGVDPHFMDEFNVIIG